MDYPVIDEGATMDKKILGWITQYQEDNLGCGNALASTHRARQLARFMKSDAGRVVHRNLLQSIESFDNPWDLDYRTHGTRSLVAEWWYTHNRPSETLAQYNAYYRRFRVIAAGAAIRNIDTWERTQTQEDANRAYVSLCLADVDEVEIMGGGVVAAAASPSLSAAQEQDGGKDARGSIATSNSISSDDTISSGDSTIDNSAGDDDGSLANSRTSDCSVSSQSSRKSDFQYHGITFHCDTTFYFSKTNRYIISTVDVLRLVIWCIALLVRWKYGPATTSDE